MKVYFAADHAGFALKQELLNFVRGELSLEVEDMGAHENDPSDDYPDIIARAVSALSRDSKGGLDNRAILIGASGQGEAMVANRFQGVRCAVYYGAPSQSQTDAGGHSLDMISSVRAHNDSNALSLGARFISLDEAKHAVRAWLSTPFSKEDRHVRRIARLDEIVHE